MRVRSWAANILLMILLFSISSMAGWSYLIDNYDFAKSNGYKEYDLRREFDLKQRKTASLEKMKARMLRIQSDTEINGEVLTYITKTDNEQSGCIKLAKIAATKKTCKLLENRDEEFYYESHIELKLTASTSQINHFFETITSKNEPNYINMSWRNLILTAEDKSTDITLEALIIFFHVKKDDDNV